MRSAGARNLRTRRGRRIHDGCERCRMDISPMQGDDPGEAPSRSEIMQGPNASLLAFESAWNHRMVAGFFAAAIGTSLRRMREDHRSDRGRRYVRLSVEHDADSGGCQMPADLPPVAADQLQAARHHPDYRPERSADRLLRLPPRWSALGYGAPPEAHPLRAVYGGGASERRLRLSGRTTLSSDQRLLAVPPAVRAAERVGLLAAAHLRRLWPRPQRLAGSVLRLRAAACKMTGERRGTLGFGRAVRDSSEVDASTPNAEARRFHRATSTRF